MLLKIVIGIAAVLVVFIIVVSLQPAPFHVERSTLISASPEKPFALVNDFHRWQSWSPYEKLDPAMKKTFSGPSQGVGAMYAWQGNSQAGEGQSTIERSERPTLVEIKLQFIKPFAATNRATFRFEEKPEGTRVTWAMDGQNGFVAKAASLFMNMDQLVGGDFEKGLASIRVLAESEQSAPAARNSP